MEKLGAKIKALRLQQGLTQAELAKKLAVSVPAVSKWERDVSLPDITMLGPIARCFHISIDQLMGYHLDLPDEELSAINRRLHDAFKESFEKGNALGNYFVTQYPNDPKVSYLVAGSLQMYLFLAPTEEEVQSHVNRMISLFDYTANLEGRYQIPATTALISLYMMQEKLDQAEELIKKLPEVPITQNEMLAALAFQRGEMKVAEQLDQQLLYQAFHTVNLRFGTLIKIAAAQNKLPEAEALFQKSNELLNLAGFRYSAWKQSLYLEMLEVYLKAEEVKKAFLIFLNLVELMENLEESAPFFFNKLQLKKDEKMQQLLAEKIVKLLEEEEQFQLLRKEVGFTEGLNRIKKLL